MAFQGGADAEGWPLAWAGILIRVFAMLKFVALLVLALTLLGTSGCKNHSGSREYIPGKGWVPN
jgi:hypothetical protein